MVTYVYRRQLCAAGPRAARLRRSLSIFCASGHENIILSPLLEELLLLSYQRADHFSRDCRELCVRAEEDRPLCTECQLYLSEIDWSSCTTIVLSADNMLWQAKCMWCIDDDLAASVTIPEVTLAVLTWTRLLQTIFCASGHENIILSPLLEELLLLSYQRADHFSRDCRELCVRAEEDRPLCTECQLYLSEIDWSSCTTIVLSADNMLWQAKCMWCIDDDLAASVTIPEVTLAVLTWTRLLQTFVPSVLDYV